MINLLDDTTSLKHEIGLKEMMNHKQHIIIIMKIIIITNNKI